MSLADFVHIEICNSRLKSKRTEQKYGRYSDTKPNKMLDLVQPYDISNSYTLQLVSSDEISATRIYTERNLKQLLHQRATVLR